MANGGDSGKPASKATDPTVFMNNMARVMNHSAEIVTIFARRAEAERAGLSSPGTESFDSAAKAFSEIAQGYAQNPEKMLDAQFKLWQQYTSLWQSGWKRFLGEEVEPVIEPARGDRRFKDAEWQENQIFDFLKQSYLIAAKWAHDVVGEADDVDDRTRHRAQFYVDQIANALSPSNFALTNPEVLRLTLETNAENLVQGLAHLAEDLEAGGGELRIKQTDLDAFEVGHNIAITPGKVVHQNDLMQLIQYEPVTEQVYKRPLLIVPPWINKYYILDLNPKKSFIKWLVDQGFTVFVISWVNPDERLAMKTFADYMHEGIIAGLDAVEKATATDEINVIGYCIGGTLLASSLAYLAEKGDDRVKAATFLTTQVDFEKAGDLLVFVDEPQIQGLERSMAEKGYFDGAKMATTFNLLRSNDLIWSYVVNNYLLGKEPMPFDLLYWNSDSTRLPAAMHSFYLRECYLDNKLSKGEMVLDSVPVDLGTITVPSYNLAAREDHIAPLPSTFRVGKCLGGETRFVVAGSGHIAGVVNPPDPGKYQYWTNDKDEPTLEAWLESATEHPGSWWPDWLEWMKPQAGPMVKARKPGGRRLKPIEDAPGSYVKMKS